MRPWVYLIIAIWIAVCVRTVNAEAFTTDLVISDCRVVNQYRDTPELLGNRGPEAIRVGFCMGYLKARMELPHQGVCIPNEVTVLQAIAVFLRWADQHPERWHLVPADAVAEAWQQAFPCAPCPTCTG
jgi:hypothetical protein